VTKIIYASAVSGFFASGDKDPTDDRAHGFDAIFDDLISSAVISFWNRQAYG
jgi:hypothetical protein